MVNKAFSGKKASHSGRGLESLEEMTDSDQRRLALRYELISFRAAGRCA